MLLYSERYSLPCTLVTPPHSSIESLHSTWYPQCWSDVDSTQLLVETEGELDQLSALPQATVTDWDLYQHIVGHVSTVQANAPVLERLRR